ncbi:MAG: hypothetical protein P4L03_08855 [Terracidiphilus sp.]|nr:hypothetical protein [Terracidiphilus sp.]
MPYASCALSADPNDDVWQKQSNMFLQLRHARHFLSDLKHSLRYGELSRAPLRLLRFQIVEEIAECDWMARRHDQWDEDLPRHIQLRHASLQAIRDAIDIRMLLFDSFPDLETASVSVFRESGNYTPEMILTGTVQRNDQSARNIHSIVMRAKILGFRFCLENDVLIKI